MNGIRAGARFLFAAMTMTAGMATAIPVGDPDEVEAQQQFQQIMDGVVAEMMTPGPRLDGWDRGGTDIFQLVREAPGGSRGNYLLTTDKDGERNVTIIEGGAIASLVPEGWTPVLHAGNSERPEAEDDLSFAPVDGRYFMAGWDRQRRVGDSFCSTGRIGAYLYRDEASSAEGEIPVALVPALFHAMAQRLKEQVICWRYDRQGEGYRVRYFLEDGRTLPALDAYGEVVAVVPAADIRQLLRIARSGD